MKARLGRNPAQLRECGRASLLEDLPCASIGEGHHERAHRHLLVGLEDLIRDPPDLLVGEPIAELVDQAGDQLSHPMLMLAAVLADLVHPVLDQVFDAPLDLVPDLSDLLDRAICGIPDVPVLHHRGDEWALGAAGQRHRPIRMELHLQGEALRPAVGQIETDLLHRLDHDGVNGAGGLRPCGLGADVVRRVPLEEGLSHLRAAGVLGADEQDVLHRNSSPWPYACAIVSIDKCLFNRYMYIDGCRSGAGSERRGLWAYYYVNPEALEELSTWLSS